jgi:septation ring formation regulator EzrA
MASAEQLKMTHGVDDRVKGVAAQVQDVRSDVQDVRDDVQDVRGDMQDVGNNVRGFDDKLDQANRSLPCTSLIVIPRAQTASQVTSSEMVSYDGFRPQIHPPIITSHSKLITTAQLNGFSKELYTITGNLPVHSCGYTENVRYS